MSDENSKPPISHNHSAKTALLRWSAVILLAVISFYTLPAPTALAAGQTIPTHALLNNSPAIDAGDNSVCPTSDQRDVARPYDGDDNSSAVCDVGAYEWNSEVILNAYLPVVLKL